MRDAIVYSGWSWETFNVPERTALALADLGSKVLYVENPISMFKRKVMPLELRAIRDNIFAFRPIFLGHRLKAAPFIRTFETMQLISQILRRSKQLNLRKPLFFYPYMDGLWSLPLEMKRTGHFLVRMLLDQSELNKRNRLSMADFTLLSPKCGIHHIRESFTGRACLVPHAIDLKAMEGSRLLPEPEILAGIPRPRLCYLGPAVPDRLNLGVVKELLQKHPEWHFIFFGDNTLPDVPNAHAVPWTTYERLPAYIKACEVGFMPYNCEERQLHIVPLKLYEHFGLGKPVVITPMIHLWEYEDVIYRGHTPSQLENAVIGALSEPEHSPKRHRRVEIAREHSIGRLSEILRHALPLDG